MRAEKKRKEKKERKTKKKSREPQQRKHKIQRRRGRRKIRQESARAPGRRSSADQPAKQTAGAGKTTRRRETAAPRRRPDPGKRRKTRMTEEPAQKAPPPRRAGASPQRLEPDPGPAPPRFRTLAPRALGAAPAIGFILARRRRKAAKPAQGGKIYPNLGIAKFGRRRAPCLDSAIPGQTKLPAGFFPWDRPGWGPDQENKRKQARKKESKKTANGREKGARKSKCAGKGKETTGKSAAQTARRLTRRRAGLFSRPIFPA